MVDKNQKKVIDYLQTKFHHLKKGVIYKALRQKDIRVNGEKISENIPLHYGDELTLYLTDDVLFGNFSLTQKNICYEDENILVVDKPQDMLVISEENDIGLDKLVYEYLQAPAYPCHRLDRNTAGLIIFAKSHEIEQIMFSAIKERLVQKKYHCMVYGHPRRKKATLTAYLFKDSKKANVIISDEKLPGYQEIITKYEVLKNNPDNTSLLEVELVTGRTHQIRAHLAHIGHPIIGDGKYGINEVNKAHGTTWQMLTAYQITFTQMPEPLAYLNGKEICQKGKAFLS